MLFHILNFTITIKRRRYTNEETEREQRINECIERKRQFEDNYYEFFRNM
ncbi:YrzI family small protein [Salipaludibacillus sp. LMS25]|jgi:uncharacterized protein (TIGR02413 family)|nr:YrzI family small protein [Salipaludibacillus sp. LMS25]UTR15441.1 YrzI family small protein [Salipaludibacillus sp. LMS25]